MRDRVPFASVKYQMLSSLAAMAPAVSAGPSGIVATTLLVATSMRDRVLSPQFGTQTLPNPTASPEQGSLPTGMTAATLFVFGSNRAIMFFGLSPIHTESGSIATQSGDPSTTKTASGWMLAMGRCTPGSLMPFSALCSAPEATSAKQTHKRISFADIMLSPCHILDISHCALHGPDGEI